MKKYVPWIVVALSALLVVCVFLLIVPAINENDPATTPTSAQTDPPTDPPHTHSWLAATCMEPKTCKTCGATEGEANGHSWENKKCSQCGEPQPSEGLEFTLGDGNYYIVSGLGSCKDTHIIIPDTYNGLPVVAIDGAFYHCESLTDITIPKSITYISGDAFQACKSLTNVTIPDGVTSIDDTTFAFCESLVSVVIPNSVESIGSFAFYGCHKLENITIPKGIKILSSSAFAHCYSLVSVTIPDSVTNIHDRVFESCTSLESVTIPHSVTEILYYAFDNCEKLTSITYTGTMAQWENIKFWHDWNTDVPATKVVCSDGTVSLSH